MIVRSGSPMGYPPIGTARDRREGGGDNTGGARSDRGDSDGVMGERVAPIKCLCLCLCVSVCLSVCQVL